MTEEEAQVKTTTKRENVGGMKRLEELKEELYRCIHCRACRFAYSGEPDRQGIGEYKGVLYEGMLEGCPAGHFYGWEGFWNAGLASRRIFVFEVPDACGWPVQFLKVT